MKDVDFSRDKGMFMYPFSYAKPKPCISTKVLIICSSYSYATDLAKDFLQNFADAEGEAKYISILVSFFVLSRAHKYFCDVFICLCSSAFFPTQQDVANRKVKAIEIDLGDLFDVCFLFTTLIWYLISILV